MDRILCIACLAAATSLAGCASQAPATNAMGAGRACDLRVDVAGEHVCKVAHVTPPDPQAQLVDQMHSLELHTFGR
jgi:hypothetical protein